MYSKEALITAAVATTLASGAAYALPPSATIDYTLYAGGGSAQANAFVGAMYQILYAPNVDSYTSKADGSDDGAYRVLTGTVNRTFVFNGTTVLAGKNVMYFYKFNGGSFANGIALQVGAGSTLDYPTVASVTGTAVATGVANTTGKPSYKYTQRLGDLHVPDWGVADVEVKMFSGINNPTGNLGGTNPNTDGGPAPVVGKSDGIYDNIFGVAVTHNLYTDATHPKTNFTRVEVEGIFSGAISDWSALLDDNNSPMSPGKIIVLDRGEGSGTKAAGNQYFFGFPGNVVFQKPASAKDGYTALTLAAPINESTFRVINESSSTTLFQDLNAANAAGARAIGVLGLEFPPFLNRGAALANGYDFVKLNNVAVDTQTATDNINGTTGTSYVNVILGKYDFFYQISFNTRAGFLTTAGIPNAFANEVEETMQSTSFPGAASGVKFPAGVPGTLIDGDVAPAIAPAVTLASRSRLSPAPLQPAFTLPLYYRFPILPVTKDPF